MNRGKKVVVEKRPNHPGHNFSKLNFQQGEGSKGYQIEQNYIEYVFGKIVL
jgi:hypothetical protein